MRAQAFELDSTKPPVLVWWRTDQAPGWLTLDHFCGGHTFNRLSGWVKPIAVPLAAVDLLWALSDEKFAAECRGGGLAYEVADEHRRAYIEFLEARGMKAGDISMLQQAVYPLDTSSATLETFGVESDSIPVGASLLVLGWNDD